MALTFTIREVDGVTVVKLDGRITLGEESNSLRIKLKDLINAGKRKIILNLSDVTFLDSAGLGTLVAAHHSAVGRGALLKLCHLGADFCEKLQITKLATVFDVFYTETDALGSFSTPPAYCLCPTCGQPSGPPLPRWSPWARWDEQTCGNPACGARFSIAHSQKPENVAPISKLSFPTYENEHIEIQPGSFFRCLIVGRLDLFASSALRKSWESIPKPKRVLVDLQRLSEVSEPGYAALATLLADQEDDARAVVSLEGLSPRQSAMFPQTPPFYRRSNEARAALGYASDTPKWLARVKVSPLSS